MIYDKELEKKYNRIFDFHEGVAVVYKEGVKTTPGEGICHIFRGYGLIDEFKNIIIPPKYDYIYSCSDGLLRIKMKIINMVLLIKKISK